MTQTNLYSRLAMSNLNGAAPAPEPKPFRKPSPQAQFALEALMQRAVSITYVAGLFPRRSETFVYREVRELRNRGWDVSTVSLHDSADAAGELSDLARGTVVVYGSGMTATLKGVARELAHQPIRLARTLATGLLDAVAPGEPLDGPSRLKLIGGAVAGVGLASRLRESRTRHLHCHFAHAPSTVGMYAAMQLGVPFSFTGHANDLFQRRTLLKKKLERAAFVACISQWHRELYRNIAPADDTVYPLIRCGVDVRGWKAGVVAAPHEKLQILTVCRLVEKKGVDTLLRGLAGCDASISWQLTVAGDGPDAAKLKALAAELGVQASVQFLGAVPNEQVRELLTQADLFALPCRDDASGDRDGIPVVLMEAMACGVPVIAGDLPAVRELVQDGATGLLVDGTDPATVTAAVSKLTENPALRLKLSIGGRKQVEREFASEPNVSKLERMVEQSISHAPGGDVAPEPGGRRYALITPCRDEAKYARRTLDSVTQQSVPPAVWVIVDDGSKDETPKILAEYAAKFPYIRIITRGDRGDRKLGGGVIDAFYSGYETINPAEFDYVCKLDLDLDLPSRYFETLMERMEANPRIGTASGKPYFVQQGKKISEMCGDENSVGMVKFYRTACFEQIGGFVRELMWDGIDCHRCRMAGWIAVSWDDAAIRFEHLRPMGTSHKNWWTGRVRHGVGQWFMGTGPSYMLASALFRMTRPPVVMGGLAMLWGYARSAKEHKPRYGDAEFRRFLRRYQWDCLLRGKAAATEHLNRVQSAAWNKNSRSLLPTGTVPQDCQD